MRRYLGLSVFLCLFTATAGAEPRPIRSQVRPHALDSGITKNDSSRLIRTFDRVLEQRGAPWMRLHFSALELSQGSYAVVTSLADGDAQLIDAESIRTWGNSSAYFNGDRVRIELFAAPNSRGNRITIEAVVVGEWEGDQPEENQCGPSDNRTPTNHPAVGRLMSVGCTASIISQDGCMMTAGHCLGTFAAVVEFNVPQSQINGTIVHPPVADQYVVQPGSQRGIGGGMGNDWGLFRTLPNTQTGLTAFEAQGDVLTLAAALPAIFPTTLSVTGFGQDTGSRNQTQQTSTGPLTAIVPAIGGPTLSYQVDTESGNSGSPVTAVGTGEVIGIHTHGGCNAGGANFGTPITHAPLHDAIAELACGDAPSPPITCADVTRFRARCRNGRLRVSVQLANNSHSGETVTVVLDGAQIPVTIQGSIGILERINQTGTHTAQLIVPNGCFPPANTTCN